MKLLKELIEAQYTPQYRDDFKQMRGSAFDWAKQNNITKQDIKDAMSKVRETNLFKKEFPDAGLIYSPSSPNRETLGTFNFKVSRNYNSGVKYETGYQVHVNGQIRCSSDRSLYNYAAADRVKIPGEYTAPLKSPEPVFKEEDPVDSLVKIYMASLEELLSKWKKSVIKMNKSLVGK